MRGHTRSWIAFCGFPFEKKKIPSLSVALTFAAGAQLSIAIVGGVGGEETRKEKMKMKKKKKKMAPDNFQEFLALFKTATAAPANPNSLSLFQSARFSAYWCVCVCSHTFEDIVVRATLDYTAISSGPFKNGLF